MFKPFVFCGGKRRDVTEEVFRSSRFRLLIFLPKLEVVLRLPDGNLDLCGPEEFKPVLNLSGSLENVLTGLNRGLINSVPDPYLGPDSRIISWGLLMFRVSSNL